MTKKTTLKSKILSLILAFCGVFAIISPAGIRINARAAEDNAVAQVGSTKYTNYLAAWNQVSNGGTITLLKDWTTHSTLTVAEDAYVTVNMNGHMINRNLTDEDDYGSIFSVEENATLNILGNNVYDTVHYGNIVHDKWTYQPSGTGNIPIYGSLLTGGYSEDGGGAIIIWDDAEVYIKNVNVVGNAAGYGEYGGAIYVAGDDAYFTSRDSNISYNLVNDGYGGAIYSEGYNASVQLSSTRVNHNVATEDSDGGAIYIEDGYVMLFGSTVSYNRAGGQGGAAFTYGGYLFTDTKSVLSFNSADEEGGAIYVDNGSAAMLSGKIIGNSATLEGGAIYVNAEVDDDEGLMLSNIEIMGNASLMNGGAIFVDSDDDILLHNRVEIYSNTPNNLYIQDEEAICENRLTSGSNIGIYTSWEADEDDPVETSNYQYFFSDKMGKDIAWCDDGFYFKTAASPSKEEYKVGNVSYPLIEDVFRYSYDFKSSYISNFFYSDGYFASHPKYYNTHLSTFAISLAMATMPSDYEGDYAQGASKNVVAMLEAIDFKDIYLDYEEPEYYGNKKEDISTIGYVIANKDTVIRGDDTTIVIVSIRGGSYFAEWASNFTVGGGNKEHDGFKDASSRVKRGIDQYLINNSIDTSKVKFLVTGFSRSAATANLLSKELTDLYGESAVYGYCYEPPKGGVESEMKDGCLYTNIHNIINKADLVPYVATTEMAFIRYGVDHYIPGYLVGTEEYETQKIIMLNHLQLFNPNIEFSDYFHEATLEYIASTLDFLNIIYDLVDENYFTEHDYAEHWSPYFFSKLQEYSFNDMLSKVDMRYVDLTKEPYKSYTANNVYNKDSVNFLGYRNFYANYKWYIYLDGDTINNASYDIQPPDYSTDKYTVLTLQGALTNIVNFYFSAPAEKYEKLASLFDVNKIINKLDVSDIYFNIIKKWCELSIEQRNAEFNNIWTKIGIESDLATVLSDEEMHMIKTSVYVLFDLILDFISQDYDETDQDILGTLIHNASNILNKHTTDIVYSWVKSYDSFYTAPTFVCAHLVKVHNTLQEPTLNENGVRETLCVICGGTSYEVLDKLEENNHLNGVASLIGNGSVVSIICMSVALVAAGISIFFYVKTKKKKSM